MIIYHGSDLIVHSPRIMNPTRKTDFGKGFYTTESKKQAERWASVVRMRNNSSKAYINLYEFEINQDLKIKRFSGPTEEWLDFVMTNRLTDKDHRYDIVMGPVADDDVYETLHRYQYGLITKEETIYLLKSTKLDGQILFHTDKSLESISFIGEQEVR